MCEALFAEVERLLASPRPWENPTHGADFTRRLRLIERQDGQPEATKERARALVVRLETAKVRPSAFLGSSARPL
jgi:hypothetical protein